jgi:hypothetical protein
MSSEFSLLSGQRTGGAGPGEEPAAGTEPDLLPGSPPPDFGTGRRPAQRRKTPAPTVTTARRGLIWGARRSPETVPGHHGPPPAQAGRDWPDQRIPRSVTAARTPGPLAPAWGWPAPGAGRAVHVAAGTEYQATTHQLCGLFPFVAGSGSPLAGTPVGRHLLWGEVVCLDPLAWQRAGLVTNPGMFVLGEPGIGKSALVKRLITGAVATGTRVLILGDTKPDYTRLTQFLGGQVIRAGRGLDRINPLDAGPLGAALHQLTGPPAGRLRAEVRGRRLSLLLALVTLVRGGPVGNAEEVVLGRAVDLLDERNQGQAEPTIPAVLTVIEQGPDTLRAAARAATPAEYRQQVSGLVFSLALLCCGSLAGMFDGPTTHPIDPAAPVVSVDISTAGAAGDTLLAAAMLCVWSYGFASVDAATALAEAEDRPRRPYLAVLDELWRALRGAPGLVEHADALTRLNRAKGMAHIMVTHSLADLDALPSQADRAKARGFADRSAITVLAGLPPRELAKVSEITPLTGPEQALVASWSAPASWQPGTGHPGRGKYLIKTGERLGIPVQLTLTGAELDLYDTDQAIRAGTERGCW